MIGGGIRYFVEVQIGGFWTSLGADPQAIAIARGRDDDLAFAQAGTCTIRLHDHTGKYSAVNAASSLYPSLRPRLPVRVQATYLGVTYGLFSGYLDRCETDPDYGVQQATMQLTDLFARLGTVKPVIASLGMTTTGAAIGAILDNLSPLPALPRDLDTGDALPDFAADGTATGLALIEGLLATARGVFFVNGSGVAVYDNRHARWQGARASSQATIAGTMRAVAPGTDIATIRNTATVTRTGGAAQTYADSASAAEFDPLPYAALTSPYLASDNQARSLASYLVQQRKHPTPTARRVRLLADEPSVRVPLLARDLGDRVTVTNALTGLGGDYHIEKLTHTIDVATMRHTCDWTLSKRPATGPFLIGISTIGSTTDLITY